MLFARFIGVVTLAVGAAAVMSFSACSLGPQPPQLVGAIKAPIDFDAVRLYVPKCEPKQYEAVAKLDASKLGVNSSYDFNMNWIEALRKQAAGLGANGIILTPIGVTAQGIPGHGPGFKAKAIREPLTRVPAAGTSPWAAPCVGLAAVEKLRYKVSHKIPYPRQP